MSVEQIQPGMRYTKNGISVEVDCIKDSKVYVRRWPKDVTQQSLFANCIRMPVAEFLEQVRNASVESN